MHVRYNRWTTTDIDALLDSIPVTGGVYVDESWCQIVPEDSVLWAFGYPKIHMGGRTIRLNRYSLERKLGRNIYSGMHALHKCDNRACVAQNHLYEGTNLSNVQDKMDKGHSNLKLNINKVRCIRRLYSLNYTCQRIADVFTVSPQVVSGIVRRASWRYVE